MDKYQPHYPLRQLQTLVQQLGSSAFTVTAIRGGAAMGLTVGEMLMVIAALNRTNFYKSMTTYADHRVWQDVYHADIPQLRKTAYIKMTLHDGSPVIQFKEKQP